MKTLMVIALRFHIRVRGIWLPNEYLEGKIEVIIAVSREQRLIHDLQRCLESLRTTLPEKFRGKYAPYNRQDSFLVIQAF